MRSLQDIWILLFENLISKQKDSIQNQHGAKLLSMIEYLHSSYNEKFSLSDMADKVNVSRGECCRFFKKMMHMTISQYLLEYRISKAIEMIEHTELTIAEISEEVGFSSNSFFIKSFRKKTGLTPLSYKKSYKIK